MYIVKVVITAILVVVIAEVSKRSTLMAGVYASIPLTSLIAMVWLYIDTENAGRVASLSWSILLAIVPSHIFLIVLPIMIKLGTNFWLAMLVSILATVAGYYVYIALMKHFGINF